MPAQVLARHVPVEEAAYHCVLCVLKAEDFASMKSHISSARYRALLSMADDAAAATSLGQASWVYQDEGLGANATAVPISESICYWRLHQQASRMEAKEVTEEDLPIRLARIQTLPADGKEFVSMCENFWELPGQVPVTTEEPTPTGSCEAVEATASDEGPAEQVVAAPTAEPETVAATPTGTLEQEPAQAAAVPTVVVILWSWKSEFRGEMPWYSPWAGEAHPSGAYCGFRVKME